MQQVQFTPGLQNNSSFYLRKLSNYNFCVSNSNGDPATMFLWSEIEGSRGSNEISSCIYKYITERYSKNGRAQRLIIWFDRCVGQNNNTIVLSTLMKLVRQSYFKEVVQKFFVTGHSFNDCDRKFGLIEKKKRNQILLVPSDIEALISDACPTNPFTPIRVKQEEILDFKTHSKYIRHTSSFRVTQHLFFRYSINSPNTLFSKRSHRLPEPEQCHALRISLSFNLMPGCAYTGILKIDSKKLKDIKKLTDFLHGEAFAYFTALILDQEVPAPSTALDNTDESGPTPTPNSIQTADLQEYEEIRAFESGFR